MLKKLLNNQSGQTLIETLVALSFLVVGLTGAVVIAIGAIRITENAEKRAVAEQLAQESIELLRLIRDSSGPVFKDQDNNDINDWASLVNLIDPVTGNKMIIDASKKLCVKPQPATVCDDDILYADNVDGFYRHSFRELPVGPATTFQRVVTLEREPVPGGAAGEEYVQATVDVSWTERGRGGVTPNYELRVDLYDWN